jgi:hypothetical protein
VVHWDCDCDRDRSRDRCFGIDEVDVHPYVTPSRHCSRIRIRNSRGKGTLRLHLHLQLLDRSILPFKRSLAVCVASLCTGVLVMISLASLLARDGDTDGVVTDAHTATS